LLEVIWPSFDPVRWCSLRKRVNLPRVAFDPRVTDNCAHPHCELGKLLPCAFRGVGCPCPEPDRAGVSDDTLGAAGEVGVLEEDHGIAHANRRALVGTHEGEVRIGQLCARREGFYAKYTVKKAKLVMKGGKEEGCC